MAPITPKALSEREFTKTIRGYSISEVDEYIGRIVENYSILYRENIELARRLSEATGRLENLSSEEELVKQTLQTAKKAGDKIIEEAYIKADDILASIKSSCDSILRNFRDKIEAQKTALADIQQNILTFKNELFEKYRLHIELIEQISPVYEYEEELSPDEYVERVVTNLKKEVAAQYGISLDTLTAPDNTQTKVAEDTSELPPATPEAEPPIVEVHETAPLPPRKRGSRAPFRPSWSYLTNMKTLRCCAKPRPSCRARGNSCSTSTAKMRMPSLCSPANKGGAHGFMDHRHCRFRLN